jgi:uncharacterized membrane protein YhiD involved in acid resistance
MDKQLLDLIDAPRTALIYGPADILLNLAISFMLCLVISFIYRRTHKGLSYSQSFVLTIVLVGIVVAMVMMVIGNNLARAFALVGALSIIRFRTVVKDTKDTAYVFFALAAGMAAGTSNYFLGVAGTAMISSVALLLHWTNYGSLYKSEFILSFRATKNIRGGSPSYSEIMGNFSKSSSLLHTEASGDGETSKLTFDVVMKKGVEPNDLTSAIAALEGISEVRLVVSRNDVDY